VAIFTGLVWFFADQANLETVTAPLTLRVQPAPNSGLVILDYEPNPPEFEVTFRAPRGVIRQVAAELQTGRIRPVYTLAGSLKPGRYEFDSARLISGLDAIRQRGLTVLSAKPQRLTLQVDRLTTTTVRLSADFGNILVDMVQVQPERVQVTLPASMLASLPADGTLRVDMSRYLKSIPAPGTEMSMRVPLQWPQQSGSSRFVTFDPAAVLVRFRTRGLIESKELPGVQVSFMVPPEVLKQYDVLPVDPAEFRPNIVVRGPKQIIDNLNRRDVNLLVEVLTSDEANVGKPIRRKVLAVLPPGVEAVEPLPEVRFILKPKQGQQ